MSKELKVTKKDIVFNISGEGFVSQRSLAKLLGMAWTTFNDNFKKLQSSVHVKVNKNNQIHEDSLYDVVEFMAKRLKANQSTKDFFNKLKKLGARTLLVGLSGNPTTTTNQVVSVPMTYKEALLMLIEKEEEREKLQLTVDDRNIETNKSDEWFPVSHVKALNPSLIISGAKLSKMSRELELPIKKLFSNYNTVTTNTYHYEVWMELYPNIKL